MFHIVHYHKNTVHVASYDNFSDCHNVFMLRLVDKVTLRKQIDTQRQGDLSSYLKQSAHFPQRSDGETFFLPFHF